MAIGNKKLAGIVFMLGAAACQPVPPAPIPVPPPIVVAPPAPPARPLPPGGAASSTVVPPFGADGIRVTPNRGLSTEEHIWNFRIALNVAALNCRSYTWDEIGRNYNQMLSSYKNTLARVNRNVDAQYRSEFGRSGLRKRDTQTTELYNYFALPTVKAEFCNAALQTTREVLALAPVTSNGFRTYAVGGLNDLDRIFINFFDAYAQYEVDLAAWDAQYGASSNPASTFAAPVYSPPVGTTTTPASTYTSGPTAQPIPAPPAASPSPVTTDGRPDAGLQSGVGDQAPADEGGETASPTNEVVFAPGTGAPASTPPDITKEPG